MVIYAPLSFTQEITRTQTKSRLSVGSLGSRLRGSQVDGNLLSKIAKMADRSFADRVVLAVNAAIYRNGEEKPAMRWSFEMGIGGKSDKMLFDFIFRVREGFGIADQCSQLNIERFRVTLKQRTVQRAEYLRLIPKNSGVQRFPK